MKERLLNSGYIHYPPDTSIKIIKEFIRYLNENGIRARNNLIHNKIELE